MGKELPTGGRSYIIRHLHEMKKLLKDGCGVPYGITDVGLILREAPANEVDPLVKIHHYSHKNTRNRFKSFLVNGNQGFIQLGYGIRPHMKHTISKYITKDNYCEFDRMWLSDDLPKFSESRIIGLLISYLKQVYTQIHFMITYADGSVGNTGIIYRATNAFPIGKKKVDFYILPSGERVHPVTMWHRHKTRAKTFLERQYPGYKHVTNEYQYRFLYILNNKERRRYLHDMRKQ